jgi:hypothetical protein
MTDAFEVMMQNAAKPPKPPKPKDDEEPIVIGVVYRRMLLFIAEIEPLYGISYFGQAVRSAEKYSTPEMVAQARWTEENLSSKRESKDLGLLAALECYGEEAFKDEVMEYLKGPRSIVQAWADDRERALIEQNGGVLRDMNKKLKQTLNRLPGGKVANCHVSMDAFRSRCFDIFKAEMEEYVAVYNTSLVPKSYITHSQYKLGKCLFAFRQGALWTGHPDGNSFRKWAESLPRWQWNVRSSSEEWSKIMSISTQKQWKDDKVRERMIIASKEARNTPKYTKEASERALKQWREVDDQTRAQWLLTNKEAHNTPQYIVGASERQRRRWVDADEETRANWTSSIRQAVNTTEYRTQASIKRTQWWMDDSNRARMKDSMIKTRSSLEYREGASERTKKQWAVATTEKKAAIRASIADSVKARQDLLLSSMSPNQREMQMEKIEKNKHAVAVRRADLELLRMVEPLATQKDLPRARREGLIPSRCKRGNTPGSPEQIKKQRLEKPFAIEAKPQSSFVERLQSMGDSDEE